MLPTAPGGSESVRPVIIWWPSGRVISRCETEFAPACFGTAEASSTVGWKGFGSWQPVMLTLLGSVIGLAAVTSEHRLAEVLAAVARVGQHGIRATACVQRRSLLNGTSGLFLKTVLIWPFRPRSPLPAAA